MIGAGDASSTLELHVTEIDTVASRSRRVRKHTPGRRFTSVTCPSTQMVPIRPTQPSMS